MNPSSKVRSALPRWLASTLVACCLVAPSIGAPPAPAPVPAADKRVADDATAEQRIKAKLEVRIGAKIDAVKKYDVAGLYEVRVGDDIFYTDAAGDYLIVGNVIDSRTRENLTRARVEAIKQASLPPWKFGELPLASAVKIVRGNGKREVAIFEDPNCGYCKKLEKSILDIGDVTIYVFLYPVLGPDSLAKSKQIWCAPNRAKAWTDWMQKATELTGDGNCTTPLDQMLALGKKLKVEGTPTLFFSNNRRVEGAVDTATLEKLLAGGAG